MESNSQTNTRNLPKIAIFYDWLNQWGGAEKVLLNLIKIFPEAPIYTLVHDPKKTHWLPKNTKVITSFLNKLPFSSKNPIFYTPFYDLALEQFDFNNFDIVISTTTVSGHCLLTNPKTLFICYFHNINRYIYNTPKEFRFLKPFINIYKKIDKIYSKRPDCLICNSKTVQKRIEKKYLLKAQIIHPGINLQKFHPVKKPNNTEPYFLVVSRLVSHKKIDITIKACFKLGLKLIIVGVGRNKKQLIKLKNDLNYSNVKFLGKVKNQKLINLYQNCEALICTQLEDFGLVAIEAQACGKPVIGFYKGGNRETIINNKTGILFKNQTVKSLSKALQKFYKKKFNQNDCVKNAQKFSSQNFMLNFKKTIFQLWENYRKIILY